MSLVLFERRGRKVYIDLLESVASQMGFSRYVRYRPENFFVVLKTWERGNRLMLMVKNFGKGFFKFVFIKRKTTRAYLHLTIL